MAEGTKLDALTRTDPTFLNSQRPAVDLPSELLEEIFSLACSLPSDRDAHRARHSITSTCHWWRVVAISQPSLWLNIIVPVSKEHTFDNEAVACALDRSSGRCVDVTVKHRGLVKPKLWHHILNSLRVLLWYSRTLKLEDQRTARVSRLNDFPTISSAGPIDFPHLQHSLNNSSTSPQHVCFYCYHC